MEGNQNRLYPDVVISERKPLINSVEDGESHTHPIYPTLSEATDLKPRFEIFFVVMPLFCGYACLFALQAEVKGAYGIANNNSALSHDFGIAASLVYIGNFVFRLGHNIVFAPFQPRTRVIISMFSMAISMAIISSVFFFMKNPSLVWVFLAYAFGGLAVGTFESNLLSTITPLGKQTKLWAILAIPSGILSITVGGFILLYYGVEPGFIYLAVCVYLIIGMALFLARFYFESWSTTNAITMQQFFRELSEWREWLPKIKWHSLALLVDMFCVSMFSPGVMLYIFDQPYINFPWFHSRLPKDWLFVIYDAGFFLGDSISRKVFYPVRILFPLVFWVFAAVGVACALSNVSFFVPFAGFFVAFCNGSIYAQANRQIDSTVDRKYNLIAFSFWLFIGDIGSVIGSNLISYVSVDITNLYNR